MLAVSSTLQAALAAEQHYFAWLISIGADLHFTTHAYDLTHDGKQFLSKGDILRLSNISRERDIKLQSYSIELSNVDRLLADTLNGNDLTGEDCDVSLALLDEAGVIINDEVIHLYRGAFDSWVERESSTTSVISLKLTSPWDKPNLTAGRITSQHNQSDRFTGDQFFSFAHEEKNTIGWGAKD